MLLGVSPPILAGGHGHGGSHGGAYGTGLVHVRSYYRSDGTFVQSHYRTAPDGNFYNNWSTAGNVNPFTGRPGTKTQPSNRYGYGLSGLGGYVGGSVSDVAGAPVVGGYVGGDARELEGRGVRLPNGRLPVRPERESRPAAAMQQPLRDSWSTAPPYVVSPTEQVPSIAASTSANPSKSVSVYSGRVETRHERSPNWSFQINDRHYRPN
jgi:hypothetical protein